MRIDWVQMEERVRSLTHKNSRKATVEMTVVALGTPGRPGQVHLLINSDWKTGRLWQEQGQGETE